MLSSGASNLLCGSYCGEEMVEAHSALADSQAALKVLIEQASRATWVSFKYVPYAGQWNLKSAVRSYGDEGIIGAHSALADS